MDEGKFSSDKEEVSKIKNHLEMINIPKKKIITICLLW